MASCRSVAHVVFLVTPGDLPALQRRRQRLHAVAEDPDAGVPEGPQECQQPHPRGGEGHRLVPQRHARLRVARHRERRDGVRRSRPGLQRRKPHLPGRQPR